MAGWLAGFVLQASMGTTSGGRQASANPCMKELAQNLLEQRRSAAGTSGIL